MPPPPPLPLALRARWTMAVAVSATAAIALAALQTVALQLSYAEVVRYLLVTLGALLVVFAGLWRLLPENRRTHREEPLPNLGLANSVTVVRAILTALLVGQLTLPWPRDTLAWLPAGLYLAVVLGDAVDGWLARRGGLVTRFGSRLDLEVDAAALLIATLLAVCRSTLPPWVLLAGLARYVYVVALAFRRSRGGTVEALPSGRRRRLRAGQQMGLVAVALWPSVPAAGSRLAAFVITLPFLTAFVRDFLVVTKRVDPDSPLYRRARQVILSTCETVIPVTARLVLLMALFGLLAFAGLAVGVSGRWRGTFVAWGWPATGAWALLPAVVFSVVVAATVAVVLGALPRVAALVVTAGFYLELQSVPLDAVHALLLAATLWILVFGAGPWTLWAPDEASLGAGRRHWEE